MYGVDQIRCGPFIVMRPRGKKKKEKKREGRCGKKGKGGEKWGGTKVHGNSPDCPIAYVSALGATRNRKKKKEGEEKVLGGKRGG